MKSLREKLNLTEKIFEISAKTIEEAILLSFKDDKYKFYLNSELIDINNRFRIFKYQNTDYIVKKSSLNDGQEEVKLANKAFSIIDGLKVDNFNLKVILPQLYICNNSSFVITEYKGISLQECLYNNKVKFSLNIQTLENMLEKFLSLGVLYRGFLPRNTIIIDNNIFLLDWEDVIFCENKKEIGINKLWATNFLLNWSYFFDVTQLSNILKKYENPEMRQPNLLKYEIKFGNWINNSGNDVKLRNDIFDTVMDAERKILINDNEFCILPNDIAHLVADLFNSDIDVLFDISCKNLRNKEEDLYYRLIKDLSNLIVDLFYNKLQFHSEIMIFILVIFSVSNLSKKELLEFNDNYNIRVNEYREKLDPQKNNKFAEVLNKVLKKIIFEFNGSICSEQLTLNVINYVKNLCIGENNEL